jgi:plasmid maintenance system antidote protein VapI
VAKRKKIPATLSDQLQERITQDGRSQSELARVAGIDRAILWRFMTLKRTITLETADRLAAVLRLRLADDEMTPKRK